MTLQSAHSVWTDEDCTTTFKIYKGFYTVVCVASAKILRLI